MVENKVNAILYPISNDWERDNTASNTLLLKLALYNQFTPPIMKEYQFLFLLSALCSIVTNTATNPWTEFASALAGMLFGSLALYDYIFKK